MPNDIKFHYTSVNGMASIMNNKSLRITRSEFLNDPSDCKVLLKLVKKYVQEKPDVFDEYLTKENVRKAYKKAPIDKYVEFLCEHIHLYVFSLTTKNDQMSMWNYYGDGGMQLHIDVNELIAEIKGGHPSDMYFAYLPVTYISDSDTVESIKFNSLENYRLDSKEKEDFLFKGDEKALNSGETNKLQAQKSLADFLKVFANGYIHSLEYLLGEGKITLNTPINEIFEKVVENTKKLHKKMEFKKEMYLFMIALSACIKNDTYVDESEWRIVCFKNSLSEPENVDYAVHELPGRKFIKPFLGFKNLDMNFINGITLSPLTQNLPIEIPLYRKVISDYCEKRIGAKNVIQVHSSRHEIRW